jgi:hypothetical protein
MIILGKWPFKGSAALARARARLYIAVKPNPTRGETMTTFDERRNAFEKKFAHDEDLRFKAMARRNKLFGLWAAQQLGKTGEDAQAYAKSVVMADFEEAGDADVLRKVRTDLEAAGKASSETELRRVMEELMIRAAEEIQAGR